VSATRQSVLLTGTSSGIGRSAARHFAARGWNVAATMRSPEKEKELGALPNVKLYRLDVTDSASIESALHAAERDFGRLDAVVNNAGYGLDGVFEAMSDDVIRQQFETNVFGLMRVTRAAIPILRARGGGSIVQVASMGGRLAFPLFSIYHATKWAVEGFTESLHYELRAAKIRLKLIEPGTIKTEFYGRSRVVVGSELPDYREIVERAERVSQAPARDGVAPEVVAHAIERAALHRGRRMRFPIGRPAPLLLALKRVLPESWFFSLIARSYGL
jgi:NAD(P)-dependent dehydrogenase (short-subunit alcohol dehydrogenase family)